MSGLFTGFGRVIITPMMGIRMRGYYQERRANGVLDDLEINAIALTCGDEKALLISLDLAVIAREIIEDYRKHVSEVTHVPERAIYIHATHPHTGPHILKDSEEVLEREYYQFVYRKIADAAQLALADLKPTKMGWGVGNAPNVAFVRRYRMKDGSIRTNPGVDNPDILEPIGEVDERVSVLRFDREDADTIILTSFGNHPDTIGGCKISADWPGFLRRTVEQTLEHTKCIFVNGIQGDVNHVNVHPTGGDLNDMMMDFDDVSRGYGHARYVGRVVTAGVLQAFDKVKYVDVSSLKSVQRTIRIPSNQGRPEELKEAYHVQELHQNGRDDELPFKGMLLTTELAKASRMIQLEHGPEYFEMGLSAVAIGKVVLVGIPGEPFAHFGLRVKETEEWELVIPTCLTNGGEGYFPTNEAYEEGGYEAASTRFKAGVEDLLLDETKKMMNMLR